MYAKHLGRATFGAKSAQPNLSKKSVYQATLLWFELTKMTKVFYNLFNNTESEIESRLLLQCIIA